MTYTPIAEGTPDWDDALNAAITDVDARLTTAENTLAGLPVVDSETIRDTIGTALQGTGVVSVTPNDAGDTIVVSSTATVNQADATLLARANHTGTQSADTITDGSTNKAYTATEKTKLAGVAASATANSPDGTLLARANHTGSQASATISDLTEVVQDTVAAMFSGGSQVGIVVEYDDVAGTIDQTTAVSIAPPVRFSASQPSLGFTGSDRAYVARTFSEAHMRCGSAPIGSALTVLVQAYNGTSWSTAATLTIADGDATLTTSVTGLSVAQVAGNLCRLSVTSIGSGTPATDVVVDVLFT